uniref:Uncharacterized protein n=1 Tax=viral metagenome TaxID=1070528 RepID=A0A6C0C103_9ZZZZ
MFSIIIAVIIITIILYLAFIKIKYPYWSSQPVYHSYDLFNIFYSSPYVHLKQPYKSKYYDCLRVKTVKYVELENKHKMIELLQTNYIESDELLYEINEKSLDHIYQGSQYPCFISVYNDQTFTYKDGKLKINKMDYLQGVIGSKPILFNGMNLQFVVHQCCEKNEKDNKKINRTLLQSHVYNIMKQCPENQGFLIRKNIDDFEGVVPFVCYDTYCVQLDYKDKKYDLPQGHFIVKGGSQHLQNIQEFITNMQMDYKICYDLVYDNDIIIYLYYVLENLCGIYVLKKTHTYDENAEGYILEFVSSYSILENPGDFCVGFDYLCGLFVKENVKKLHMHDLGHNNVCIERWKQPTYKYKSSLYLYNVIVPRSPVQNNQVFSMS